MFNWCTSLGPGTRYTNWDTSGAIQMRGMFRNAHYWTSPDLGKWNVSRVERMDLMFSNAYSFNTPIGGWDVSSVKNMSSMFTNASSFNQNITGWNISNVRLMTNMFRNAISFKQNLCPWGRQVRLETAPNTTVLGIFTNTNCPSQDDPQRTIFWNQQDPLVGFEGPWCYSSCD
jgi:surface protein